MTNLVGDGEVATAGLDFKLTLTGPGVDLSRSVSAHVAGQIMMLVVTGTTGANAPAVDRGVKGQVIQTARHSAPPSMREFFNSCNPTRGPERIAAIAYHLRTYRVLESFKKEDVVRGFEDAKEPVPKNLPRDLAWTIQIGWIAVKTGDKDTYYLTRTGNDAVENGFPDNLRRKTRLSRGSRRKIMTENNTGL